MGLIQELETMMGRLPLTRQKKNRRVQVIQLFEASSQISEEQATKLEGRAMIELFDLRFKNKKLLSKINTLRASHKRDASVISELHTKYRKMRSDRNELKAEQSIFRAKRRKLVAERDKFKAERDKLLDNIKKNCLFVNMMGVQLPRVIPDTMSNLDLTIAALSKLQQNCVERRMELQKCPICWTNEKKAFMAPCGHQLCHECMEKVNECPFCRKTITKKIPIY